MDLLLSLEEFEEVEIIDDGLTEAEIREDDPEEDIEDSFKKIDNAFDVIHNLKTIRANIKKFGLTREMLDLVNKNGELGKALNLPLPYCENDGDNDADDIDMDNVPADDVLIASMEGLIGDTKEKLKKFFQYIWDKLKQFGNWIKKIFGFKEKEVAAVVADIKPENIVKAVQAIHARKNPRVKKEEPFKKTGPNKTAADIDDVPDDEHFNREFILKKLEEIHANTEIPLTFLSKAEFAKFLTGVKASNTALGQVNINETTGDVEKGEALVSALNDFYDYTYCRLERNRFLINQRDTDEHGVYAPIDKMKLSTLKLLGYGDSISEFEKEGMNIISLLKDQTSIKKYVNNMEKRTIAIINKLKQHAPTDSDGEPLPEHELVTINMKMSLNGLFRAGSTLQTLTLKVVTLYISVCKQYKQKVISKLLQELKSK